MAEGVVDTAVSAGERLAYAVFDDSMSVSYTHLDVYKRQYLPFY